MNSFMLVTDLNLPAANCRPRRFFGLPRIVAHVHRQSHFLSSVEHLPIHIFRRCVQRSTRSTKPTTLEDDAIVGANDRCLTLSGQPPPISPTTFSTRPSTLLVTPWNQELTSRSAEGPHGGAGQARIVRLSGGLIQFSPRVKPSPASPRPISASVVGAGTGRHNGQ